MTVERPESGAGSFEFGFRRGGTSVPITVWTYRPASWERESPILVVMHGATRNARAYRDAWIAPAESFGVLVLAPEFSKSKFPTPREYEVGNMRDRERRTLPEERWAYAAVEQAFDEARAITESRQEGYEIFGHSAGGQFVHRLLTFASDVRVRAAVIANTGCYTLLDESERFPYGLGGMPLAPERLAAVVGRDLTILLGEKDDDPEAPLLLRSPEALRQGAHRLARGQHYYRHGAALAATLAVPFGWRLKIVGGVGHVQAAMAAPAAELLYGAGRRDRD